MVEISASSRLYFALLPEALSLPQRHAKPQSCTFCYRALLWHGRLAQQKNAVQSSSQVPDYRLVHADMHCMGDAIQKKSS